jgi:hypothetical protein
LPRGTHPSGHDAAIVAILRWARTRDAPFVAAELGERGRLAMDSLILNRYVEPADGLPIPQGWAPVPFVLSAAGRAVLARADAADVRPAAGAAPRACAARCDGPA